MSLPSLPTQRSSAEIMEAASLGDAISQHEEEFAEEQAKAARAFKLLDRWEGGFDVQCTVAEGI